MAAFTVLTWDPQKADANQRKHGVGFDEATSALLDPMACVSDDPDHPDANARFILLGLSMEHRVPVICHCHREEEHVIRIISARIASPDEIAQYRLFHLRDCAIKNRRSDCV